MFVAGGRKMDQILVMDGKSFLPQLSNRRLHVDRIPDHDGIGE
jgi:hypothetical protein